MRAKGSNNGLKKNRDTALQELLKKVRRIEIRSRYISRQLFSGEYHSAFKGRGMSFVDVRPYQYGDDIRFIDWNVTARYKDPYIKTYEEERELTVMLMIDLSQSDAFGTNKMTKRELITELCAVLGISANANNDAVGAVFFTDRIERFIPPRKGRTHVLRIIREILDFKPQSKGTDIAQAMNFIVKALRKKSIVFFVSDFIGMNYATSASVAARKHDLIGVHVFDRAERELPDAGLILVKDPETGVARWMDTSSRSEREKHRAAFLERTAFFMRNFGLNGADYMSIETGNSYLPALHRLLKERGKRKYSALRSSDLATE